MAENYRLNIRSVLRSNLPAERKQTILSRLLKQITALYENSSHSLSQNMEDLTEEEREDLRDIRNELIKEIKQLTRQS